MPCNPTTVPQPLYVSFRDSRAIAGANGVRFEIARCRIASQGLTNHCYARRGSLVYQTPNGSRSSLSNSEPIHMYAK